MMYVIHPEGETIPVNSWGCAAVVKGILPCAGAN